MRDALQARRELLRSFTTAADAETMLKVVLYARSIGDEEFAHHWYERCVYSFPHRPDLSCRCGDCEAPV